MRRCSSIRSSVLLPALLFAANCGGSVDSSQGGHNSGGGNPGGTGNGGVSGGGTSAGGSSGGTGGSEPSNECTEPGTTRPCKCADHDGAQFCLGDHFDACICEIPGCMATAPPDCSSCPDCVSQCSCSTGSPTDCVENCGVYCSSGHFVSAQDCKSCPYRVGLSELCFASANAACQCACNSGGTPKCTQTGTCPTEVVCAS